MKKSIIVNLVSKLNNVFNYAYPIKNFVITKSITKEFLTDDFVKKKYDEFFKKDLDANLSEEERKKAIREIREENNKALVYFSYSKHLNRPIY